ncbi:MAG: hypothetical protein IK094_03460 [Treponema sp.]|nr:hypothetical protein [Treponema sp.]
MKKLSIIGAALVLGFISTAFCAKNNEPETAPAASFNGAEKSAILNTSALTKRFDGNVRLISGIEEEQDFIVRYYDTGKKDWVVFGSASTTSFADTSFVKSRTSLGKRRWVAVTPEKAGSYKYDIAAIHNDLYIFVFPTKFVVDEATKAKASIIDPSKLAGKYNDNIVIVNETQTFSESFTVYGFENKDGDWSKIGRVKFEALKEDRTIKTPYEDILAFKYFAIVPTSGKPYTYTISAESHDLVITAKE